MRNKIYGKPIKKSLDDNGNEAETNIKVDLRNNCNGFYQG